MKKSIIHVASLLLFVFACEKDNPVITDTGFHKVIISFDLDSLGTKADIRTIITFDDKSSSTPPEFYYFTGKNIIDIRGFCVYPEFKEYYNRFYGNLGNMKEYKVISDDSIYYSFSYKYNNKGLLSELLRASTVFYKYKYDQNNKISEIIEPSDNVDYATKIVYSYGPNGLINNVKEINYLEDTLNVHFFIQNEAGYLIKSYEIGINPNDTSEVNDYFYNINGKLEKKIEKDNWEVNVYEYYYNANGKIIKEILTRDGDIRNITNYIYDENNFLIETKGYNKNYKLQSRSTYKYE